MTVRMSTQAFYKQNTDRLLEQQTKIAKQQNQISSGVKVVTPSEDPIAFATAQRAENSLFRIEQYARNMAFAKNYLTELEVGIAASSETMIGVREKIIQAQNTIVSLTDRKIIANELRSKMDEMLSYANTKDSAGNFLFSGTRTATKPFDVADGYQFAGTPSPDSGISFQVADGREMDLSINGQDVYTYTDGTGNNRSYFAVLQDAIDVLEDPTAMNYNQVLGQLAAEADQIFDNAQIARGRIGDKINEIDSLTAGFKIITTELQSIITQEVATDLTETISSLAQSNILLQAAQQSFASTSKLSLFDYL